VVPATFFFSAVSNMPTETSPHMFTFRPLLLHGLRVYKIQSSKMIGYSPLASRDPRKRFLYSFNLGSGSRLCNSSLLSLPALNIITQAICSMLPQSNLFQPGPQAKGSVLVPGRVWDVSAGVPENRFASVGAPRHTLPSPAAFVKRNT